MIEFFEKGYQGYLPNKTFPNKDNIINILRKELKDFKEYMWGSGIRVKSDDALLKLILNICPELTLSFIDFTTKLHSSIESGKDVLGLITTSSKGKVFKNNFYTYESSEMFMLVKSDLGLMDDVEWRTLNPISVISTTNYHINFYTAKMKDLEDEPKFNVFGLKLFDLVMMYRGWALERKDLDMDIYPDLFIGTVVYPKIWDTLLDMSIVNRFSKLIKGELLSPSKQALPYSIKNIEPKLDKYLHSVIEYSKTSPFTIPTIFNFIPKISEDEDIFKFKHITTVKNKWVLWYGRVKWVNSLLDLIEVNGGVKKNGRDLSNLKYTVRRYFNQSVSGPETIPLFYEMDIDDEFDELEEKIKTLKL